MPIGRRIRGLFGMAATWAALFGTAALILIAIDRLLDRPPTLTAPWFLISRYVGGGAAVGALFASILMLAEHRGILAALKTWRVAAWGFAASAATLLGFSVWDFVNGAYPPSTPIGGWLWTSFDDIAFVEARHNPAGSFLTSLRANEMSLAINDYLSDRGLDKWVAELGCANAPVPRQGIRTSLAFFAREMPRLSLRDAVGFLAAMDLSKPVRETTLPRGERLLGFRTETESPFKLFFARRGASAQSLGINAARRGPVHFVVREPVRTLESSTISTKDSWTPTLAGQSIGVAPRAQKWLGKEFGVMVLGGGQQLIIPESFSHLLVEGS